MILAFVIPVIAIIFLSVMVWRLSVELTEVKVVAGLSSIETQYRPLRNYGYAISAYKNLVSELQHPLAQLRLAQVAAAAGDIDLAREAVIEIGDEMPWQVASTLAYLNWAEGKNDEALRFSEIGIEQNPCDIQSLNLAAWILATTDQVELESINKAERYAKGAVHCSRERNPEFLDTLAEVYIKQGRLEEAVEQIKKAQEAETGLEKHLQNRLDELSAQVSSGPSKPRN